MLLFTPETGWDQARTDVRYSIATLRASGAHARLLGPLLALVEQWGELDVERQTAPDVLDDANAVIAWLDEVLDAAVNRFSAKLQGELGTRDHDVFTTFFPDAPSAVTELALERECDRVAEWATVRKHVEVSDATSEALDEIAAIEARGRAALTIRKDALTAQAGNALRIQAWKGGANSVRRTTETSLDQHANTHKFPRDYSDRFFLRAPRAKAKKPAPQPAPQPAPR